MIRPASAGGTVTITRLPRQFPRGVLTLTPPRPWSIRRTGAFKTIDLRRRFARLSAISCEPPTIRLSWAPFWVSIRRLNPPAARV